MNSYTPYILDSLQMIAVIIVFTLICCIPACLARSRPAVVAATAAISCGLTMSWRLQTRGYWLDLVLTVVAVGIGGALATGIVGRLEKRARRRAAVPVSYSGDCGGSCGGDFGSGCGDFGSGFGCRCGGWGSCNSGF